MSVFKNTKNNQLEVENSSYISEMLHASDMIQRECYFGNLPQEAYESEDLAELLLEVPPSDKLFNELMESAEEGSTLHEVKELLPRLESFFSPTNSSEEEFEIGSEKQDQQDTLKNQDSSESNDGKKSEVINDLINFVENNIKKESDLCYNCRPRELK